MNREEFEEIIKPLFLLRVGDCNFQRKSLLGNFEKWKKTQLELTKDKKPEEEWISVEDQEPPKDGTEFISARFNSLYKGYDIGVVKWYDGTFAVIPTRDFRLSLLPTHWKPLTPPIK